MKGGNKFGRLILTLLVIHLVRGSTVGETETEISEETATAETEVTEEPLISQETTLATTEQPPTTTEEPEPEYGKLLELNFDTAEIVPGSDKVFNKFATIAINCPTENDLENANKLLNTLAALNFYRVDHWQPPVTIWLRLTLHSNLALCLNWATQANHQYSQITPNATLFSGILSSTGNLLPLTLSIYPQNPHLSSCHPVYQKMLPSLQKNVLSWGLQYGLLLNPSVCQYWSNLLPENGTESFNQFYFYPEVSQLKIFRDNMPSYLPQNQVAPILASAEMENKNKTEFQECKRLTEIPEDSDF